jgi:hypothetical protein
MAAVARPRNNLQQQLAWFNSQKPHIPPQSQQAGYLQPLPASTVAPIVPNTANPQAQMLDIYPALRSEPASSVPTQPVMRNPPNKRTEARTQQEEVEVIASEETPLPSAAARESAFKRLKNDIARTGLLPESFD